MTEPSIPKKIIWLASYPKSGNTWFRAFLTALLNDGELDINEMKTDGIFSSRAIFENRTDTDSTELYEEEVKNMLPGVFCDLASDCHKEHLFIKIHDAYTMNANNIPVVPAGPTICAMYFIRNPLDVAASFASHNASTINDAIKLMNNPMGCMAKQKGNYNVLNQFPQLTLSWSGHVESWTGNLPFPVMVLRYEDMLADTLATFTKAIEFTGITVEPGQIEKAIAASKFEQLQQKEQAKGFSEKTIFSKRFFRKGQTGGWKNELTEDQAQLIIAHHEAIMKKYNYTMAAEKEPK